MTEESHRRTQSGRVYSAPPRSGPPRRAAVGATQRGSSLEQLSDRRVASRVSLPSTAYPAVKRFVDVVGSSLFLVLLSPLLIGIGVAIALETGFPILYRCERLGQHGRKMTALKFRTMRDGSHHHLQELLRNDEEARLEYEKNRKLRDDPRRTRVGTVLRRTSLDELPQLWNVLMGHMSLIGPRPYFLNELEAFPEATAILSVRPGITGLWQVSGRSNVPLERRVALDTQYVRERGYRLDARIALRTFGAVISGRGAY